MAINVLLTRKFFETDIQFIKNNVSPDVNIIIPDAFTEDDLLKLAPDADIFLGPIITKSLCTAAKKLKFIQVPWTGVDNLDFDLIQDLKVKVCNSHSNASAVAEHAVALMFAAAKKITYHDRTMRLGNWNRPKPDKSNLVSPFSSRISESEVGIIGHGHIGKSIVSFLSSFKCHFHIADLFVKERATTDDLQFYPMSLLSDMLNQVDFVFTCVPLTLETYNFFGINQFKAMKKDAILINTSRGEIIDEDALYIALKNNIIGGVAMDTWYNNPKSPYDQNCKASLKHPFEKLDNLVMSPHRAAMIDGELPHLNDAVLNINRALIGLEPINIVNPKMKF